jgi:putative ABC transport system permease protein
VNGHEAASAIKFVSDQWKKLNPDTPFSYGFLDAIFQSDYSRDQSTRKMAGIFATMAIFISCLGLLGLITYSLTRKAREIGIRKVLGASVKNIVMLFYKQYFKLVLTANLIALPLGWYFMRSWLSDFPYKVTISWWMFAVSLLSALAVALLTISFKTIKAATINPVESLRNE